MTIQEARPQLEAIHIFINREQQGTCYNYVFKDHSKEAKLKSINEKLTNLVNVVRMITWMPTALKRADEQVNIEAFTDVIKEADNLLQRFKKYESLLPEVDAAISEEYLEAMDELGEMIEDAPDLINSMKERQQNK